MDQRLSIVTLGVRDLALARAFYEDVLGWKPTGDDASIVFYNVGSIILALYPSTALAADFDAPHSDVHSHLYRGFTLAQNLATREEVDALFDELRTKGVQILKEPHAAFWGGYTGYFADMDGNAWEVAHNPFWKLGDDGRPVAPPRP